MDKHYVGEVGTDLILDTGILVGSASDQYILYRNPNGVTGSFDASVYSSYSQLATAEGTYLVRHTLETGDFDTPGTWRFHAFVSSVAGTWHGSMVEAKVFDTFS